jgi:thiol-disulfide isomerase/thioredoxin
VIRRLLRKAAGRALRRDVATPRPDPIPQPDVATPRPDPIPQPDPQPDPPTEGVLADLSAIQDALGPTGRPRLVNHWATWCEGCVEELPLLVKLHERFGMSVDFLGLSWDGFQGGRSGPALVAEVADFSRALGLPWRSMVVGVEPEALFTALKMEVHTVPQIWLIDEAGTVVHRVEAVLDEAGMDSLSAALIALSPAASSR